jgi:formamidopyrimidine-DNA glycosylase
MPELPDIRLYLAALEPRLVGHPLERIRLASPFLLRSVEPPLTAAHGRTVTAVGRLGKRIVISLDDDLHLVLHLMIAGRFRWLAPGAKPPGRIGLACFDLPAGTLALTEAGSTRRASLHLAAGAAALAAFDRGGLDVEGATPEAFAARLRGENHTLKRSADRPAPSSSGIGNAYSDEILHHARLSPLLPDPPAQRRRMLERLYQALPGRAARLPRARLVARGWATAFPDKVTAFRPEMAVHGRYGLPCPTCGQRRPAHRSCRAHETNYCPTCQNEGRLLADRGLSRLLREDWPRTLVELEERRRGDHG